MKRLSSLLLSVATLSASAQLTVTDSLTNATISQLLEGLNVSISNVQVNCPDNALAHFTGTSELAISEGILLTSGEAASVAGPVSDMAMGTLMTPGDADLEISLGGGMPTYDACVLEFDCIPYGDTLLFNFSFGSEEYPEFVGSGFNDVFAIYLSGPGFPMPTNVAALPDGTPVAINNVNAGINPAYFHDNEFPSPGQYVSYDGFTTNLTAFAVVSPGDTYHFKVAIADVGDMILDSGVFLEAFSFRSVNLITTSIGENATDALRLSQSADRLSIGLPVGAMGRTLCIFNASGSLVRTEQIASDRMEIGLASLASGVYTVRVSGSTIAPVRFVNDRSY